MSFPALLAAGGDAATAPEGQQPAAAAAAADGATTVAGASAAGTDAASAAAGATASTSAGVEQAAKPEVAKPKSQFELGECLYVWRYCEWALSAESQTSEKCSQLLGNSSCSATTASA